MASSSSATRSSAGNDSIFPKVRSVDGRTIRVRCMRIREEKSIRRFRIRCGSEPNVSAPMTTEELIGNSQFTTAGLG